MKHRKLFIYISDMRKFSPISLIMMQSKLISKAKSCFTLIKEPAQPQNQHQNSHNLDPLICRIDAKCQSARALTLTLQHGQVNTPIYMPVGTKGAIKGITQIQMQKLNCSILLANTYHLATSLGTKYIDQVGGLHRFAGWNRNILTDSGGYQMVSFGKLIEVEEQGVHFDSPYGEERIFLRPEDSIKAQNEIGADIIMAFDDVIKTTIEGDRVLQSVKRTSRWFGRCWDSHSKKEAQNLFPIIQGTTNPNDREVSLRQLMQFQAKGFAIGGLSGGQNKQDFYSTVKQCCDALPVDRPRYLMGVGYPIDLVLCAALGVDMFDCVFATRTARFGTAFTSFGQINLKGMKHANEFQPIESGCSCQTCSNFSRAYLCFIRKEDNFSHLISIHNVHFLLEMMRKLRTSIILGTLRQFLDEFIHNLYRKEGVIPYWVQSALKMAQISIQLKLSIKNEENRPNSTT